MRVRHSRGQTQSAGLVARVWQMSSGTWAPPLISFFGHPSAPGPHSITRHCLRAFASVIDMFARPRVKGSVSLPTDSHVRQPSLYHFQLLQIRRAFILYLFVNDFVIAIVAFPPEPDPPILQRNKRTWPAGFDLPLNK